MSNLRIPLLGLAALSTVALAATRYSLIVNGQVAQGEAVVVNGETYVPLSALKLLGVRFSLHGSTLTLGAQPPATAPGGANQRPSLEGCVGETLFNGVWRLKMASVKPLSRYDGQQRGYALGLEWKNGTTKTIDALNTGVKTLNLVLADGTILTSENVQELQYRKLPQAAGATLELPFWASSAETKAGLGAASRLLVEIDAARAPAAGVVYSTPTPSFRVRLDCQK